MNIFLEALGTFLNTVVQMAISMLKAIFGIKDSIDSFQDLMLATVFGVPVWVITLIGGIITVACATPIVIRLCRKF